MSQRAVEQLIGRLITDAGFRERAQRELGAACREEGYDLSHEEHRIVASLDFARLSQMGDLWLDDRIKRSVLDKRGDFE